MDMHLIMGMQCEAMARATWYWLKACPLLLVFK